MKHLQRRTFAEFTGSNHIKGGDREDAPADDVETWLDERADAFEWLHPSYR